MIQRFIDNRMFIPETEQIHSLKLFIIKFYLYEQHEVHKKTKIFFD